MGPPPGKEAKDLRVILDITRRISTEFDLDALLRRIVAETTAVMNADRSSLFVLDRRTNELWTKVAEGMENREIRVPVDSNSIVGHVARTRTLLNIPDAYASPLFNREVDKKTGYRTRSVLAVPLLNFRGEIVGVVQVLNKKGGRAFTGYDEELLRGLAASAALAIERAVFIREYMESQKMKHELHIARTIQHGLVPQDLPPFPHLDLAARFDTCDETGGDYYDVLPLGGGTAALVVGDVSGHGIGAALLMATARAFLRALLRGNTSLESVFAELNNLLCADMDESRFMTLCLATIDAEKNLRYISAGHEPPLLYRASSGSCTPLESTGTVLGMMEDTAFAYSDPVTLEKGDIVFLSSDGVPEAMNPAGEPFGRERLVRCLAAHAGERAEKLVEGVARAVEEFRGGTPPRDDLTILAAKVCGP